VSRSPKELLDTATTIAVVGMSDDPSKAACRIPQDLIRAGFTVIPVNPFHEVVQGLRSYATLADIGQPIDIVDVFRPPRDAPEVARQSVAAGAGALWLQLGIRSAESRGIATAGGLDYVEDLCIMVMRREAGITRH